MLFLALLVMGGRGKNEGLFVVRRGSGIALASLTLHGFESLRIFCEESLAALVIGGCSNFLAEARNGSKTTGTPKPHASKLAWGFGGGSGIRTHGYLRITRFRIERLKPGSAIPPERGS